MAGFPVAGFALTGFAPPGFVRMQGLLTAQAQVSDVDLHHLGNLGLFEGSNFRTPLSLLSIPPVRIWSSK